MSATALTAMVVGYAWAGAGPDTFSAEGTYLVQPRTTDERDEVRAMDALIESQEVSTTFANIAVSDLITERARATLALDDDDSSDLEATASVLSGTNILKIGARGRDPALASEMASAVGGLTVAYVAELNDVFALSVLDAPMVPKSPTGPPAGTIGLVGLVIGFGCGVAIAHVADQRFPANSRPRVRHIRDERSNAHHERYFRLRLREEISRCRVGDHTFSVGVLHLTRPGKVPDDDVPADLSDSDLASITDAIEPTLRDHDVFGHLGEGRFAAILPKMDLDTAQQLVQSWKSAVTELLLELRFGSDTAISVGVSGYDSSAFVGDPVAERLVSSL